MLLQQASRHFRQVRFWHFVWLLFFAVLNGLDLLTTYVDLHAGMREGNPLMRVLLDQQGFGALIAYKMLMVLVVSAGVVLLHRHYPQLSRVTLGICNLLVLAVVISNVVQHQL